MTDAAWVDQLIGAFRQSSPEGAQLAELASLAVQVDAPLLRRLRQQFMPGADPGIEADVWFSSLIESHDEHCCVFHDAVTLRLRERLAQDPERCADAAEITKEAHQHWPQAVQLEEHLTALALAPGLAVSRVETALKPALRALMPDSEERRSLEISRWALRAAPRLHGKLLQLTAIRGLLATAALRLGQSRLPSAIDESDLNSDVLSLMAPVGDEQTALDILVHPDSIEFVTPRGGLQIDLPLTTPLLLTVRYQLQGDEVQKLVDVFDGRRIALPHEVTAVEITTLSSDRYVLSRSSRSNPEGIRWHSALTHCILVTKLGEQGEPRLAVSVEGGRWITAASGMVDAPFLLDLTNKRQLAVLNYGAHGDRLLVLEPVDSVPESQARPPLLTAPELNADAEIPLVHVERLAKGDEYDVRNVMAMLDTVLVSPAGARFEGWESASFKSDHEEVTTLLTVRSPLGAPVLLRPLGELIGVVVEREFTGAEVRVKVEGRESLRRVLARIGSKNTGREPAVERAPAQDRAEPRATVDAEPNNKGIVAARFVPDRPILVLVDASGLVRVWHHAAGASWFQVELLHEFTLGDATRLMLSDDATLVASLSAGGVLRIFHTGDESKGLRDRAARGAVLTGCFVEEDFVEASQDGHLRHFSPQIGIPFSESKERIARFGLMAALSSERFALQCDEELSVWQLNSLERVFTWKGISSRILCIGGAGSRRFVTGHADGTLQVWDIAAGSGQTWSRQGAAILSLSVAPGGNSVYIGTAGMGEIRHCRLDLPGPGELLFFLGTPIQALAIEHDGKHLVAASEFGATLWDLQARRELAKVDSTAPSAAYPVSVATSESEHATARRSGESANPSTGVELLHTLRGHGDTIGRIAWSPDSRSLASTSKDASIRVWDALSGTTRAVLNGHEGWVYSVAWSPDGRLLASAGYDHLVLVWNTTTWAVERTLVGHEHPVFAVAWSPDGRVLASGSGDNSTRLWSVERGIQLAGHHGHHAGVNDVAWSPHGGRLLSVSYDQWTRSWNTSGDRLDWQAMAWEAHDHSAFVSAVAFTPDGANLASCSNDGTIVVREAATGRQTRRIGDHTAAVSGLAFSADGQLLASKAMDGTVRLRRCDTWNTVHIIDEPGADWWLSGIAFGSEPNLLATLGDRDTSVRIWRLDPKRLFATPRVDASGAMR